MESFGEAVALSYGEICSAWLSSVTAVEFG